MPSDRDLPGRSQTPTLPLTADPQSRITARTRPWNTSRSRRQGLHPAKGPKGPKRGPSEHYYSGRLQAESAPTISASLKIQCRMPPPWTVSYERGTPLSTLLFRWKHSRVCKVAPAILHALSCTGYCLQNQCHPTRGSVPLPDSRASGCRGTSLTRDSAPLGPYSRPMPRALWRSCGGGGFL